MFLGAAGPQTPALCYGSGSRPSPEHQALEQRVARQAVRAVDAGARDLSRGKQPRDRRSPIEVGLNAAHLVVRRGSDRDRVPGRVDSVVGAELRDRREAPPY
jgi:hypothetical protein